jgi:hypothetical protein
MKCISPRAPFRAGLSSVLVVIVAGFAVYPVLE